MVTWDAMDTITTDIHMPQKETRLIHHISKQLRENIEGGFRSTLEVGILLFPRNYSSLSGRR